MMMMRNPHLSFHSPGSVLRGDVSLSFTSEKGAALILPYEAQREDVINEEPFRIHMANNSRKWIKFAETECQLRKGICLTLVTGCDLTRQWATATHVRNKGQISLGGGGGGASVANAHFSLSTGWSRDQSMNTRWGPSEGQEEIGARTEPLARNQCVFLRGFCAKNRFFGPKILKAAAGYHDPGKHGPEGEEAGALYDDITMESLSPPIQVGPLTFRYLEDINFCQQDGSLIMVLLDYMLEVVTKASFSFGSVFMLLYSVELQRRGRDRT